MRVFPPWLTALAVLTAVRLVLAAAVPLAPDEAYYLLWSDHLQAGYFDHPPMVAWWIAAGTAVLGPTPLGVRALGPVSAALGSWLVWRAGEDLWPRRNAGLAAAILLNATLTVGVGAIVMTPDTPLFCSWLAGVACLARLLAGGDRRWWLGVGAAAGFALLSKYTGVLFVASVGLWLLASRVGRAHLRGVWPWAGLALAGLMFLPNLVWNAQHGWISFLKQGGRVAGLDLGRAPQFLAELAVGQAGLATPLIFGLCAAGLLVLPRARALPGAAALLLWLTCLPGAVLLEHVVSDRVQANWPAILLPAACLAAVGLPAAVLGRWLAPAVGLGLACTIIVYAQAVAAPFRLPARYDPTALQFSGWPGLAAQAAGAARQDGAAFLTSDEYATASELALHAPAGLPVLGYDRRWRYLGAAPAPAGAVGLLVTRRRDTPCRDQVGAITRMRGVAVVARYKLCAVLAPPGSFWLKPP